MAANNLPPTANGGICVTTTPAIAPLRLQSDYRDYFGRQHEKLVELIDPILAPACFQPQHFHAPSSDEEIAGVAALGYLEYIAELPAGSFILGFEHTTVSFQNTDAGTAFSGYKCQITDIERNYLLFDKPVSEAFFLNDQLSADHAGFLDLRVLNPAARLLTAPYPVAPSGQFRFEFWDISGAANTGLQLTVIVAVPPGGRKPNGK